MKFFFCLFVIIFMSDGMRYTIGNKDIFLMFFFFILLLIWWHSFFSWWNFRFKGIAMQIWSPITAYSNNMSHFDDTIYHISVVFVCAHSTTHSALSNFDAIFIYFISIRFCLLFFFFFFLCYKIHLFRLHFDDL